MRSAFAVFLLFLTAGAAPVAAAPATLDGGRLGAVRLAVPERPKDLVFLFSEDRKVSEEATRALVRLGAVVAAVDLRSYFEALDASDGECLYLLGEIEDLSHRIQRRLGFKEYRLPILAGIGPGAGLVYGALAQAPAATVAGAASVDFTPVIATKLPLCPGAATGPAGNGVGFRYAPRGDLPGWWRISETRAAGDDIAPFVAQVKTAELVPPDGSGDPAATLDGLLRPVIGGRAETATAPAAPAAKIADLPITALPVAGDPSMMAVIYSGDGGWRDLDKQIGEKLAAAGVPVVGVDSLRYFWREKTPGRVAHDLARIIAHFRQAWHVKRVILVGYSFGADILPFAVNRLAPAIRSSVVQVSLLGLAREADFEIHVTDWLGMGPSRDARPVLPEIARLDPGLLQCVYGVEEDDTLCPDPALAGAEVIKTDGGHHFDGNYGALAQRILVGARRRAETQS